MQKGFQGDQMKLDIEKPEIGDLIVASCFQAIICKTKKGTIKCFLSGISTKTFRYVEFENAIIGSPWSFKGYKVVK